MTDDLTNKNQAKVEIYTKRTCPYCVRAKDFLNDKGVSYEEIKIDEEPHHRQSMIDRAGGRFTVPQIFIDGKSVGGCDDIKMLDTNDELDGLLYADA